MKLTFLGTGTSTGVPQLGCSCQVCQSCDPHDKRSRTSALITENGSTILVDCGPDFYLQMLRNNPMQPLDAALLTHQHTDHMGGIDDLRPFCTAEGFPIYCTREVSEDIHRRIPYCFAENPYPGVPHFRIHEIEAGKKFEFNGIEITPLNIIHGKLPILGFKIGDNLAYITDASEVPEETEKAIKGVDTLVINALRTQPHHSHMTLEQALAVIEKVKPRVAYLIHISHQLGTHSEVEPILPENVHLAYDGLSIEIPRKQ